MYRHILVPLDGSPLAEAALPHASDVAHAFGARITLLQVAVTATVPAVDPLAASELDALLAAETIEANEQAAKEYLEQVSKSRALDGIPIQLEVVRGRPAPEIVRRAQKGDLDLIVMSTHGRSGLGRLMFGSVADEVLRESGVPILLVRPRQQQSRREQ